MSPTPDLIGINDLPDLPLKTPVSFAEATPRERLQRPDSRMSAPDRRPSATGNALVDVEFAAPRKSQQDYSDVVQVDQERSWENFRQFLSDRYGSLARAFDIMDSSGDGYLSKNEFMSIVTRKERYCRASEATRLFRVAVGQGPSKNITWSDFGVTEEEWRLHLHSNQMQQLQAAKAKHLQLNGLRGELALKKHDQRSKQPPKKPVEAFGKQLPLGWGFPQNMFEPLRSKGMVVKVELT